MRILFSPIWYIITQIILSCKYSNSEWKSRYTASWSIYKHFTQVLPREILNRPLSISSWSFRLIATALKSNIASDWNSYCLEKDRKSWDVDRVMRSPRSSRWLLAYLRRLSSYFFCLRRYPCTFMISSSISFMYRWPWIFFNLISLWNSFNRSLYVLVCMSLKSFLISKTNALI